MNIIYLACKIILPFEYIYIYVLQVLYKFLDYFSKFDWDNYCVSLSGPICISSFPEVTGEYSCCNQIYRQVFLTKRLYNSLLFSICFAVEVPENCADLLLTNDFLRDSLNRFSVSSGTPEVISRAFQMKHLNIVDPLKNNNNLGRSVSQGRLSHFVRMMGTITLLTTLIDFLVCTAICIKIG